MAAAIALLLVLACLGTAILPLLGTEPPAEDAAAARARALRAERDELIAALREADLDLAMGKITGEDHAELKRSLEARAVAVMARLEATAQDAG